LWWTGVFAGGFGGNAYFVVVFLWSICGVMRGERGALATTFSGAKNTPAFEVYFSSLPHVLPDGPPARRAAISWLFSFYCC
jgi:hypothetical protein